MKFFRAVSPTWMWSRPLRRQPTAYQRCLAVHLHFAAARGGLSS